ncbi:hypothetical protein SKAU_G00403360 [Synaphobranchus kaupii]|uniref:Uncharacterized protein n=1 Tax=Synaphobranchus kaupii TaxID=118154 RepID=A0A9Q1ICL5_SYNKA|nr:hypothetical protein SKAU_G00403360 [Synaphobranchus kaupii]
MNRWRCHSISDHTRGQAERAHDLAVPYTSPVWLRDGGRAVKRPLAEAPAVGGQMKEAELASPLTWRPFPVSDCVPRLVRLNDSAGPFRLLGSL